MTQQFALGEELNITNAATRLPAWRELLKAAPPEIRLNASRLQQIDTAGIQLLLAFKQDSIRHGVKLVLEGKSEALNRQAALLGLRSVLLDS